ncbi:MAG: hypothetical protein NUW21_00910 [Elusimicrobia bacterium]|nr:hypothetical protein [Elusimicrobiota bacterium]
MKLILIAVLAAMLSIPARAEDKPAAPAKSAWSNFLKNFKNSLAQSAVGGQRKKGRRAQGVAAVRGSEQGRKNIADPDEPGLMGDSRSAKAKREMGYDLELEAAVDLLGKGQAEEGLKGLEKFKAAHPKYRAEDVDKAIEGAKVMMAEKGAAPAEKGAAPAEKGAAPAEEAAKP